MGEKEEIAHPHHKGGLVLPGKENIPDNVGHHVGGDHKGKAEAVCSGSTHVLQGRSEIIPGGNGDIKKDSCNSSGAHQVRVAHKHLPQAPEGDGGCLRSGAWSEHCIHDGRGSGLWRGIGDDSGRPRVI